MTWRPATEEAIHEWGEKARLHAEAASELAALAAAEWEESFRLVQYTFHHNEQARYTRLITAELAMRQLLGYNDDGTKQMRFGGV